MTIRLLPILLAAMVWLALAAGAGAHSVHLRAAEVAPTRVCPGENDGALTAARQTKVMLCMTNYARAQNHLASLVEAAGLTRAARRKSDDIVSCDEFAHTACGRAFTFWDQRYGYLKGCWEAGENIAWGTGTDSTPAAIFVAWLESPEHRANILGPYREIGIARRVGDLEGAEGVAVWTQDFGIHACEPGHGR